MALVPTTSKLRSALALGLVLWCAGAGCLAHGMAMRTVAAAPETKSTKANSSQAEMAMNGHACCKARHRSRQSADESNSDPRPGTIALPEDSSSDDAASCCPLTSGSFVTVSRSQTNDYNSSASAGNGLPEQSFTARFPVNRADPLRLPGHEQTYLTCCAFLI